VFGINYRGFKQGAGVVSATKTTISHMTPDEVRALGSSLRIEDMNATVTKSAKKTVTAKKTAVKTVAKPATIAKKKGSGKSGASTLKRVTTKLAEKATNALKSAAKSAKATVKIGIKPVSKPDTKLAAKAAAKAALQPAAKSASAKKAPLASKKTGAVKQPARVRLKAAAPRKKTVEKPAATKAAEAAAKQPAIDVLEVRKSNAGMSSNKTGVRAIDKIEKSVAPKVSEVATKQMKSTPVIITDGALLSEEQVLKMSEKDYMNAAQLAFFKARLQQLEKDLLKNAGETTEHLRETVLVPDPADRATIEEEHALELRTRDRERKLLKKVQQSLASIESGDYGWCEETGEPIGIPRLLARPTATLSLEAQQRRELKQKLYGD
jgi:DnaK suppressor protein